MIILTQCRWLEIQAGCGLRITQPEMLPDSKLA